MRGLGFLLLYVVLFVAALLFAGLIWWIGLGILAGLFQAPNLALDYWQSLLAAVVVNIMLGGVGAVHRNK